LRRPSAALQVLPVLVAASTIQVSQRATGFCNADERLALKSLESESITIAEIDCEEVLFDVPIIAELIQRPFPPAPVEFPYLAVFHMWNL